MFKNIACTVFFLMTLIPSSAQNNLNDYKYVIVPTKFEFQKDENQYNINALLKFLFEKNGFETLMSSEELPEDLNQNGCLALKADLIDESKLFKTQMRIQLKNCKNEVVYTSIEGVSREKEYKKAYHEAIRMAFESLKVVNYKYVPKENTAVTTQVPVNETKAEIEKLKEEIKELKAEKKPETVKIEPEAVKEPKAVKAPVSQVQTKQTTVLEKDNKVLKAELIPGSIFSYVLKNEENKIVYTLLFSGKEDVYIVKNLEALVYKVNNSWVIAQYNENDLQVNAIEIQF